MAIRQGNCKGIKFLEEPRGSDKGGIALVTFDMINQVVAAADTVNIGGSAGTNAGTDGGTATTLTLAQLIQNRRRDGKTVTLTGAAPASVFPGIQAAATGAAAGGLLYVQSATVTAGNVTGIALFTAPSGGVAVTTSAATSWDSAAGIAVSYTAI